MGRYWYTLCHSDATSEEILHLRVADSATGGGSEGRFPEEERSRETELAGQMVCVDY